MAPPPPLPPPQPISISKLSTTTNNGNSQQKQQQKHHYHHSNNNNVVVPNMHKQLRTDCAIKNVATTTVTTTPFSNVATATIGNHNNFASIVSGGSGESGDTRKRKVHIRSRAATAAGGSGENLIRSKEIFHISPYRSPTQSPYHNQMMNLNLNNIEPLGSFTEHSDGGGGGTPSLQEKLPLINWGLPPKIISYYHQKGIKELFPWQVEALDRPGVLDACQNLVYSAPTSAGKSMVADILLYKTLLERKKKAIIILPFISVTQEKVLDLKKVLRRIGAKIDSFAGNVNPKGGLERVDVAVCTIEKANNMINRLIDENRLLSEIGLIVVDELHMLGDEHRGIILELLLSKLLFVNHKWQEEQRQSSPSSQPNEFVYHPPNIVQIVGMSATIPNLSSIAKWLQAQLYITNYRPVPLYHRIVCGNTIWEYNDTNEANHCQSKGGFGERIQEYAKMINLSGFSFGNEQHASLIYFAIDTIVSGHSALVFCSTKNECERLSKTISDHILTLGLCCTRKSATSSSSASSSTPQNLALGKKLLEILDQKVGTRNKGLIAALRRENNGKIDPTMESSLRFSICYHHAGLSIEERALIEHGFRDATIRVLCATTTLSAGVNLPARRVLVMSPFNFRKQILDVGTYRQMIGRAGRKGIDTLGESLLFCPQENQFQQILTHLICAPLQRVRSHLLRWSTVVGGNEPGSSTSVSEIEMSEPLVRAILEVVSNGTATHYTDIARYIHCTFFNANAIYQNDQSPSPSQSSSQSSNGSSSGSGGQTQINFNKAIEQVFEKLRKKGLIYLASTSSSSSSASTTLSNDNNDQQQQQQDQQKLDPKSPNTKLVVSQLGKAIIAGGFDPDRGEFLLKELDTARRKLYLVDDLHMIYQITPLWALDAMSSSASYWELYSMKIYAKLSESAKYVAKLISIDEHYIHRKWVHPTMDPKEQHEIDRIKNERERQRAQNERDKFIRHKRFFAALALNDLVQEMPIEAVMIKYGLSKNQLQSLQKEAATFAGMLTVFCGKLGWRNMELLIEQFQPRLQFGVQRELIDLMRIEFITSAWARGLYMRGYDTLVSLIYCKVHDIEEALIAASAFDRARKVAAIAEVSGRKVEDIEQEAPPAIFDPITESVYVPSLDRSITYRQLAKMILRDAREIVQQDVGQVLNFDENEASQLASGKSIEEVAASTAAAASAASTSAGGGVQQVQLEEEEEEDGDDNGDDDDHERSMLDPVPLPPQSQQSHQSQQQQSKTLSSSTTMMTIDEDDNGGNDDNDKMAQDIGMMKKKMQNLSTTTGIPMMMMEDTNRNMVMITDTGTDDYDDVHQKHNDEAAGGGGGGGGRVNANDDDNVGVEDPNLSMIEKVSSLLPISSSAAATNRLQLTSTPHVNKSGGSGGIGGNGGGVQLFQSTETTTINTKVVKTDKIMLKNTPTNNQKKLGTTTTTTTPSSSLFRSKSDRIVSVIPSITAANTVNTTSTATTKTTTTTTNLAAANRSRTFEDLDDDDIMMMLSSNDIDLTDLEQQVASSSKVSSPPLPPSPSLSKMTTMVTVKTPIKTTKCTGTTNMSLGDSLNDISFVVGKSSSAVVVEAKHDEKEEEKEEKEEDETNRSGDEDWVLDSLKFYNNNENNDNDNDDNLIIQLDQDVQMSLSSSLSQLSSFDVNVDVDVPKDVPTTIDPTTTTTTEQSKQQQLEQQSEQQQRATKRSRSFDNSLSLMSMSSFDDDEDDDDDDDDQMIADMLDDHDDDDHHHHCEDKAPVSSATIKVSTVSSKPLSTTTTTTVSSLLTFSDDSNISTDTDSSKDSASTGGSSTHLPTSTIDHKKYQSILESFQSDRLASLPPIINSPLSSPKLVEICNVKQLETMLEDIFPLAKNGKMAISTIAIHVRTESNNHHNNNNKFTTIKSKTSTKLARKKSKIDHYLISPGSGNGGGGGGGLRIEHRFPLTLTELWLARVGTTHIYVINTEPMFDALRQRWSSWLTKLISSSSTTTATTSTTLDTILRILCYDVKRILFLLEYGFNIPLDILLPNTVATVSASAATTTPTANTSIEWYDLSVALWLLDPEARPPFNIDHLTVLDLLQQTLHYQLVQKCFQTFQRDAMQCNIASSSSLISGGGGRGRGRQQQRKTTSSTSSSVSSSSSSSTGVGHQSSVVINLPPHQHRTSQLLKTILLFPLIGEYCAKLYRENLFHSFYRIELPTRQVLYRMETHGIRVDDQQLWQQQSRIERLEHYIERRIRNSGQTRCSGGPINLHSHQDVARILYQQENLLSNYYDVVKKGWTKGLSAGGGGKGLRVSTTTTTTTSTTATNRGSKISKTLSTSKLALMKLQEVLPDNNLPTLIIEWRRLNHATTHSLEPLIKALQIDPSTATIDDDGGGGGGGKGSSKSGSTSLLRNTGARFIFPHCDEWTATGRISMYEPNLINLHKQFTLSSITEYMEQTMIQNDEDYGDDGFSDDDDRLSQKASTSSSSVSSIPVSIKLRSLIQARAGHRLISADYCQLELRILAHFSKDPTLLNTLNAAAEGGGGGGGDVFRSIASAWKSIPITQVSYEMRQKAKQICYGIIYGIGTVSLAETLEVSQEDAREFRKSFLQKYPKIEHFIDRVVRECEKNGYVETISHRRRPLPGIWSNDHKIKSKCKRQAVNTMIQGSAADIIKLSMCAMNDAIQRMMSENDGEMDAALVLQMHDELMYEVRCCDGDDDDDNNSDHQPPPMALKFARILKREMENVSNHLKVSLPVKVKCGQTWGTLNEMIDL